MKRANFNQIDEIIFAFVQVWSQFDSILPAEMSRIQARLSGLPTEKEPHGGTNYEVFYRVSTYLYWQTSLTMSELSAALAVPMSTATRIADWMVDRGFMARQPDTQDRRVVRVSLTDSGLRFHSTIQDCVRGRLEQILVSLTAEERAILFGLIHKVVAASRNTAIT